jgi:hypothetical protein
MQILTNIGAAATLLSMQSAGNANGNGTIIDLQTYKGAVTFVKSVGQITSGLGPAHLNAAYLKDSADNTTFTNVTGGNFAAVVNAANASNVGQEVKTFETRALQRYVMFPIEVSGTNANVPLTCFAIAQKERV